MLRFISGNYLFLRGICKKDFFLAVVLVTRTGNSLSNNSIFTPIMHGELAYEHVEL